MVFPFWESPNPTHPAPPCCLVLTAHPPRGRAGAGPTYDLPSNPSKQAANSFSPKMTVAQPNPVPPNQSGAPPVVTATAGGAPTAEPPEPQPGGEPPPVPLPLPPQQQPLSQQQHPPPQSPPSHPSHPSSQPPHLHPPPPSLPPPDVLKLWIDVGNGIDKSQQGEPNETDSSNDDEKEAHFQFPSIGVWGVFSGIGLLAKDRVWHYRNISAIGSRSIDFLSLSLFSPCLFLSRIGVLLLTIVAFR